MANELAFVYHTTGVTTLYVYIREPETGKIRDVVAGAWDTLTAADWDDYDIALSEADTGSKLYQANAPTDLLGTGHYEFVVCNRAGGSVAATDRALYKGTFGANVYFAGVSVTIDDGNAQDEYNAEWFKNGIPITSGITLPKIQVVKRSDGTDLIAETAMTEVGSTHAFKYDEGTNRLTAGQAGLIVATATIDGAVRTRRRWVSRDV